MTVTKTRFKQLNTNTLYPEDYGAVGDGVTNDQAAIQAALDACPQGGIVLLQAKLYGISTPITIPPFVTLKGSHGNTTDLLQQFSGLKVLSGYTGDAAILLKDKEQGGYATENDGIRIENLTIQGNSVAGPITGIRATGYVHGVVIENVGINNVTGSGIVCATYTRVSTVIYHPYSWTLINVVANNVGSSGFVFDSEQTDTSFIGCKVIGSGSFGFAFAACQNSRITACSSEFSTLEGFYITGFWGNGQGSGGLVMTGCSTDRSGRSGIKVDSTGSASHIITGHSSRRDGRTSTSSGYSGLLITGATTPVVVNGFICYPGVEDNGTGLLTPELGISVANSTSVSVDASYIHAVTTAWSDGGGNTILRRGVNVLTATGTTAAPVRALSNDFNTNGTGTISLTTADQRALNISNTLGNTNNPLVEFTAFAANSRLLTSVVTGDTVRRYNMQADGTMEWGSGTATRDTNLYRSAADTLYTDDTFNAKAGFIAGLTGALTGQVQFKGVTSGTVTLKANSVAGTYNFILPASTGSAGQVLTTDGTGSTSWEAGSSTAISKQVVTTATATVTTANFVIVTTGATASNITLPAATSTTAIVIKKTDTNNTAITITAAGADTIDGTATYILPNPTLKPSITLYPDGVSAWYIA